MLSVGALVFFKVTDDTDHTRPVITCHEDDIVISVKDPEDVLLSFVTAFDEKDGDISDRIFIENISPYISSGRVDITYAVCDEDNNVSKLLINAQYSDYESPRFYLKKPLMLGYKAKNFTVGEYIGVIDAMDENSSSNIIAVTDCSTSNVGDYPLDIRYTNSKFDVASMILSVTVSAKANINPIRLSRYLIYCEVGDEIDYMSYVNRFDEPYVTVDKTKVDLTTPGVYEATFYMDGKDATSFFISCEE